MVYNRATRVRQHYAAVLQERWTYRRLSKGRRDRPGDDRVGYSALQGRAGLMFSHNHPAAIRLGLFCLFCSAASPTLFGQHIVSILDANGRSVYVDGGGGPPLSSSSAPGNDYSGSWAPLHRLVQHTAGKFQVDPKLVDAVIQVESQYNSHAVSPKGAMGLMQLIPATAERFGVQDPFDPGQNVEGGVSYLRHLLNLFNGNVRLSLAAYNAGERTVLRDKNVPSIPETVDYVRKVTALYKGRPANSGKSAATSAAQELPIYRYVDGQGVTHFTNDGGD